MSFWRSRAVTPRRIVVTFSVLRTRILPSCTREDVIAVRTSMGLTDSNAAITRRKLAITFDLAVATSRARQGRSSALAGWDLRVSSLALFWAH